MRSGARKSIAVEKLTNRPRVDRLSGMEKTFHITWRKTHIVVTVKDGNVRMIEAISTEFRDKDYIFGAVKTALASKGIWLEDITLAEVLREVNPE